MTGVRIAFHPAGFPLAYRRHGILKAPLFDELNQLYQELFGRSIDISGYITYSQMMLFDGSTIEDVTDILRSSEEHRNHRRVRKGRETARLERIDSPFAGTTEGKLCIESMVSIAEHRSGWPYAMSALANLHNPAGVLLDDFVEDRFGRRVFTAANAGDVPYRKPWVGFFHNPPNMPPWFEYDTSPQIILDRQVMRESLAECRGLFVLSEYARDWFQERVDVPVRALVHPTRVPERGFDFQAFRANKEKKLLQIGYWMRRLHTLRFLDTPSYIKIWIVTHPGARLAAVREAGTMDIYLPDGALYRGRYREIDWVEDEQYDALLTDNIVFLDLYDVSACNTIIECIARNTPVATRPLPANIEYLGADYPLYFDSLEEAAEKLEDEAVVHDAHEYLRRLDKTPFAPETFARALADSDIYRDLSAPPG